MDEEVEVVLTAVVVVEEAVLPVALAVEPELVLSSPASVAAAATCSLTISSFNSSILVEALSS